MNKKRKQKYVKNTVRNYVLNIHFFENLIFFKYSIKNALQNNKIGMWATTTLFFFFVLCIFFLTKKKWDAREGVYFLCFNKNISIIPASLHLCAEKDC